jgi:hypothetical protein
MRDKFVPEVFRPVDENQYRHGGGKFCGKVAA